MAVLGAKDPFRAASRLILGIPCSIVGLCGFVILPYGSILINRMVPGHVLIGLFGIAIILGGCGIMAWATRWLVQTMGC
jgi:hypothetical protein